MKRDNMFWGVILILAAVYLIVSNLGLIPDINIVRVGAGAICVVVFIRSIVSMKFWGMLFSLAVFLILFDEQLGITAITPGPVLCAALLGSIGLDMMFGGKGKGIKKTSKFSGAGQLNAEFVSGDDIVLEAGYFNSYNKTVSSDEFKSARVRGKFCGIEISFDDAVIQGGTAVIRLDVAFSGVEIYIPSSWRVVNETDCMFGGFEEHRSRADGQEGPTVVFQGDVRFSGVEIYRI